LIWLARIQGARAVAGQALMFSRGSAYARPALVNGAAGIVSAPDGRPVAVMGFTISDGKVTEIASPIPNVWPAST
jgi:hypothetical protein